MVNSVVIATGVMYGPYSNTARIHGQFLLDKTVDHLSDILCTPMPSYPNYLYLLVAEPVGVQVRQEKVAQILLVEGGQGAGVGLAQVPQEIHGLHEDLGLGVDAALHLELRRRALLLGRGPFRPEAVDEQRAERSHHVLLDHLVAGVRGDERQVPEGAGRRVHDRGRGAVESS